MPNAVPEENRKHDAPMLCQHLEHPEHTHLLTHTQPVPVLYDEKVHGHRGQKVQAKRVQPNATVVGLNVGHRQAVEIVDVRRVVVVLRRVHSAHVHRYQNQHRVGREGSEDLGMESRAFLVLRTINRGRRQNDKTGVREKLSSGGRTDDVLRRVTWPYKSGHSTISKSDTNRIRKNCTCAGLR